MLSRRSHLASWWPANLFPLGLCALSVCLWGSLPLQAQSLFNSPLDQLPVQERVDLRDGKTIMQREENRYTGRLLVQASPELVWAVLTDYERFPEFLPNTLRYEVLSIEDLSTQHQRPEDHSSEDSPAGTDTPQRRLEVSVTTSVQVLMLQFTSDFSLTLVEMPDSRITFDLLAAQELDGLSGYWLIEPIGRGDTLQTLITYYAEATPANRNLRGAFQDVFQSQVRANLEAIQVEIQERLS